MTVIKESAKELLAKVKAIFDSPPAAAPAAPTAPASPSVPSPIVYTLADGTQIAINQAGATPAVGDMVTIAGVPAPEGVLTLQDGTLITVDATGTITQVAGTAPAAAATPPAAPIPPAPPKPAVPVTQAAMAEIVQKFAVGDPEQRLTNLELVCKALMESEFGYQISANERIESTNQAIAIYQSTLANQAAEMAKQEKIIEKYGKTIEGLFQLVEKLVELPTTNPVTLNGHKKEIFDKKQKAEDKMASIAEALKDIKHQ